MKILITAGATREPIDAVRFISNASSGRTGAGVAAALAARGHAVTLLHGQGAERPAGGAATEEFSTAADLQRRLKARLSGGVFDAVIMAAAVADYRPVAARAGKISSERDAFTLRLVRNPKLLPNLKKHSPRPLLVIGFKPTAGAGAAARKTAVERQFAAGGVDAVVHNDLEEIRAAEIHPFRFYAGAGKRPARIRGVAELAETLEMFIEGRR